MARVLIVAGGCRGRRLAEQLVGEGHAVRITTRSEQRRGEIEGLGAELWLGTPDRLATMRGALDGVTVLCWMLATASGPAEQMAALHGERLEFFMTQAIDTTVRGVVYETGVSVDEEDPLRGGEAIVQRLATRNMIPVLHLRADPREQQRWLAEARGAIHELLGEPPPGS